MHGRANRRVRIGLAVGATSLALIAPAAASAATTDQTSTIDGLAGAELGLSVATPSAMTMTHTSPGTATSVVSVVSTSLSWTLSVSDQDASGSATPGHMDLVNCGTGALLGGSLTDALQWSSDGTNFSALSATPATVTTGTLVGSATVTYRQSLAASEDIALGDCYQLTASYTVTDA